MASSLLRVISRRKLADITFRFYAAADVTVWREKLPGVIAAVTGLSLLTFSPEIVLSLSVSVPLVAQVAGSQFQLGVNLNNATITSLAIDMMSPALLIPCTIAASDRPLR
jgi:hypothetical protein